MLSRRLTADRKKCPTQQQWEQPLFYCRNVPFLWLRTIWGSTNFNGVKSHIIVSCFHLWVKPFLCSHPNFFLLEQQLSLVTLSCIFHCADVPSALSFLRSTLWSVGENCLCDFGGKRKHLRVPSEDEQAMHHKQLEVNPCIYVTVCSLGFTHRRGFLFGK